MYSSSFADCSTTIANQRKRKKPSSPVSPELVRQSPYLTRLQHRQRPRQSHPVFPVGDGAPPMGRALEAGEPDPEAKYNKTDADDYDEKKSEVGEFFVNKWLDVKDTVNNWCEAQIINLTETRILVHYKGWKSKFDEWLSIRDDILRIAPLSTHTTHRKKYGHVNARIGEKCDVLDSSDNWCKAEIVDVDSVHDQVKLHYVDWSDRYDEWIDADSPRLAILYRFTSEPENDRKLREDRLRPRTTFSASSSHEANFRRILQTKHSWEIVEMANDGNCLFRSISHQVYGTPKHHKVVRHFCVDYLESESAFFRNYIVGNEEEFEEYCRNMRGDGIWGDNIEIQCMSEMYDRPVEIYAYQDTPMKTYRRPSQYGKKPPIRLSYHFQSHYNSIIHPERHASTVVTGEPGTVEEQSLRWSALRSRQALQQSVALSDLENSELRQLVDVVSESRKLFENRQSIDFDRAVHESVLVFEEARKAKLQQDIEKAKQISLVELSPEADLQKALQNSLQEDLDKAVSQSLSSANLDPTIIEDETALLEQAISASRDALSSTWPWAVRHCRETLGFPLELCVEAYSVFGTQVNVADEIVVTNMTNYMLESSNRERTFMDFPPQTTTATSLGDDTGHLSISSGSRQSGANIVQSEVSEPRRDGDGQNFSSSRGDDVDNNSGVRTPPSASSS
eukprot:733075_1